MLKSRLANAKLHKYNLIIRSIVTYNPFVKTLQRNVSTEDVYPHEGWKRHPFLGRRYGAAKKIQRTARSRFVKMV